MFWLNIDKGTGVWKLHKETCQHCIPHGTALKGVNNMKSDGGWFQIKSYQSAYKFFQSDHAHKEYWQPCKDCTPDSLRLANNLDTYHS